MYRKVLLVTITIFEGLSLFVKCFLIVLVLFVSLLIFATFKPYQKRKINNFEIQAIAMTVLISYLGCVYIIGIGSIWQGVLFIFVVVINSFFFIRWLLKFIKLNLFIYHRKISDKFPRALAFMIASLLVIRQYRKKQFGIKKLCSQFKMNQDNFQLIYKKEKNLKQTVKFCQTFIGERKKIAFVKEKSRIKFDSFVKT